MITSTNASRPNTRHIDLNTIPLTPSSGLTDVPTEHVHLNASYQDDEDVFI